MSRSIKVGLALGSGGARGTAHIGVLQVLHREKIPIDMISGTSAGAIIGAMYATSMDPDWIKDQYFEFLQSKYFKAIGTQHIQKEKQVSNSVLGQLGRFVKDRIIINIALSRKGVVDREKLVRAIDHLLPVKNFSDLKIPLKIVATDLNTGEELIYESGDLIEAVVQSSSIPGFVPPLERDGQLIVDGGITTPLPINCLSISGIEFTIAVDIGRRGVDTLKDFNIMELLSRSEHLTKIRLTDELARKADFVISPQVGDAHWSEFDRVDEFLKSGQQAAEECLDELKEALARHRRLSYRMKMWLRNSLVK